MAYPWSRLSCVLILIIMPLIAWAYKNVVWGEYYWLDAEPTLLEIDLALPLFNALFFLFFFIPLQMLISSFSF